MCPPAQATGAAPAFHGTMLATVGSVVVTGDSSVVVVGIELCGVMVADACFGPPVLVDARLFLDLVMRVRTQDRGRPDACALRCRQFDLCLLACRTGLLVLLVSRKPGWERLPGLACAICSPIAPLSPVRTASDARETVRSWRNIYWDSCGRGCKNSPHGRSPLDRRISQQPRSIVHGMDAWRCSVDRDDGPHVMSGLLVRVLRRP